MAEPDELEEFKIPKKGNADLSELIFNEEITDAPVETEETEQKATIEELASVLVYPEEIPSNSEREFSKILYRSFRTCQWFMSVLCRFPIVSHVNEDHSIVFEYNWNSFRGSFFFVTFAILTVLTVLSSLNIVSTMLDFPEQPDNNISVYWDVKCKATTPGFVNWESIFGKALAFPKWATKLEPNPKEYTRSRSLLRAEEMFIFRRNIASLFIVLFLMYHILTADFNLFKRRHFVASYLSFWTESVEIMKIDAAGEAKKFSKRFLFCYILWFMLFCTVIVLNIAPVSSGAPVSFAFLWVRFAYPPIHTVTDFYIFILRILGGIVFPYVVICSKVYVFFFLYVCKILKTSYTVWNERLEKVFTAEERKKSRRQKCVARTGFDHLFKDYVNLLDLMNGADTLLTNIIESYFSMTLMSIVFEVYYLVRPVADTQTEFSDARTFDMILVGLFIVNSLMIFYLVSTGAAEVGEAAANGLEIIQRQGIMGHRSDTEMHFMISLYMSYTGHFDTALSGGGYFILDKPFFVAIAGTMLSYIIIIFQFQPALGLSNRVVSYFTVEQTTLYTTAKAQDLRYNEFTHLREGEFSGLQSLEELHLDGNRLTQLSDESFSGVRLVHLSLSNNNLGSVDRTAFHNASVNQLDLSQNKFESLNKLLFLYLKHNLTKLDMSRNPRLKLASLLIILSENTRLRWLSLARNNYEDLPLDLFEDQRMLQHLNMSHNRLRERFPRQFTSLASLQVLDLSHNRLRGIEGEVLQDFDKITTIREIRLEGNPFSCDLCYIPALLKWAQQSPLFRKGCLHPKSPSCLRCKATENLYDKPLVNVQESSLEWCDPYADDGYRIRLDLILISIILLLIILLICLGIWLKYRYWDSADYYTHEESRKETGSTPPEYYDPTVDPIMAGMPDSHFYATINGTHTKMISTIDEKTFDPDTNFYPDMSVTLRPPSPYATGAAAASSTTGGSGSSSRPNAPVSPTISKNTQFMPEDYSNR